MGSAGDWCLIESDPGVFTELIKDFGVDGVQVEELFTLDSDSFSALKPIYGLIFLFKYVPDDKSEGTVVQDNRLDTIFFAKQVISNACATQAIISLLLNMKNEKVKLGSTLTEFKDFTNSFDCTMRGLALSNSKVIRQVHNSFSRQQVFEFEEKAPKNEDSFHFVGYMPIDGHLYELDGLKSGPIDHGPIKSDDWLDAVRPVIQTRINRYASGEIHFNLMAIVADKVEMIQEKLNDLTSKIGKMDDAVVVADGVAQIEAEIEQCHMKMNDEMEKRQRYKQENFRRKHNYLPFIIEMLRILASEGKLLPLIQAAKQKKVASSDK